MKKLLLVALAAFVSIGLLPMATASADNPSDEDAFVAHINGLRATKGLPALRVDAGLTSKARSWAQTMADRGTISHSVLSDGITADWQRLGENVGTGGSVDRLHEAFVNSPLHYDNLVDPGFGHIGIGVVRNAGGTIFVAEEFMQLRVAPAAPAPTTTTTVKAAPAPRVVPPAPVAVARKVTAPRKITAPRTIAPAAPEPVLVKASETVVEAASIEHDGAGRPRSAASSRNRLWIAEF